MSSGNEAKGLLGDPIRDQHGIAGVSNRSVQTRALVHSGLRSLGALIAENSNEAYDMSDLAVKTRLSFEMNVQRADLLSTLCWMTTPVCRRTNRERPTHIAVGALKLSRCVRLVRSSDMLPGSWLSASAESALIMPNLSR